MQYLTIISDGFIQEPVASKLVEVITGMDGSVQFGQNLVAQLDTLGSVACGQTRRGGWSVRPRGSRAGYSLIMLNFKSNTKPHHRSQGSNQYNSCIKKLASETTDWPFSLQSLAKLKILHGRPLWTLLILASCNLNLPNTIATIKEMENFFLDLNSLEGGKRISWLCDQLAIAIAITIIVRKDCQIQQPYSLKGGWQFPKIGDDYFIQL